MDYNYNYNYNYNYAYESREEKTDPQATADDPFDPLLRRLYVVHTTCCLFCRHHDVLWGSSDYAPTGPASRCVMAHRVALLPPTGTTGKSSLVRQSPKRHLITVRDRCFGAWQLCADWTCLSTNRWSRWSCAPTGTTGKSSLSAEQFQEHTWSRLIHTSYFEGLRSSAPYPTCLSMIWWSRAPSGTTQASPGYTVPKSFKSILMVIFQSGSGHRWEGSNSTEWARLQLYSNEWVSNEWFQMAIDE